VEICTPDKSKNSCRKRMANYTHKRKGQNDNGLGSKDNFSTKVLHDINHCRIYLQVLSLIDIVVTDGKDYFQQQ
jgi:hypothetical protein